jgi:hypothetical protein
MPIHWAVENLFTLQILQPICVVGENFRDFKGADPEGIELAVLAFILSGHVPQVGLWLAHLVCCYRHKQPTH